jgi:hypothetical protein
MRREPLKESAEDGRDMHLVQFIAVLDAPDKEKTQAGHL